MRLWAGPSAHFIRDTTHNQIAEKLRDAFFAAYRYKPSPGEVMSWRNSLRATSQVFQEASLNDHGVLLEYQLPLTSRRLDCMICGRDGAGRDHAVILELKQWDGCSEAVGDKMVSTFVGGAEREVLHPSVQAGRYAQYLADTHTAFHEDPDPIRLDACAYLHNYFPEDGDVLLADVFRPALDRNPLFSGDDVPRLKDYLVERLEAGDGSRVLARVEESRYRPSKRLMDHVAGVIKGRSAYNLIDEQVVVYEKVLLCARQGFHDRKKNVLIIEGGPGTGKSVVAINLMADLLRDEYDAQYATGSRAFTGTLREIIGSRGATQFKFFNSYIEAKRNAVDVLLCDEAHRIRKNSSTRFKKAPGERPQVEELIEAARVSVFFIDPRQGVKPDEIGSIDHIEEHAKKVGARVHRYKLEAQFRCEGSEGFVNWIDNTLGIAPTANQIWSGDERFDFQIASSVEDLDRRIRERSEAGFTARLAAGFCWKWSKPNLDRTLVPDVVVGDWRRPWNARPGEKVARGIPPATLWAHDPGGIEQVGCVYTAQGFEFDYAGVIWGPDLRHDLDGQRWIGDPKQSFDTQVKRAGDRFTDLVKNTYRVLLSRGLKGCYVYFMDRDTERFVKSRMEVARP